MTRISRIIIVVAMLLTLGCLMTGCGTGESFGSLSEAVACDMDNGDLTIEQKDLLSNIATELTRYSDVEEKYLVEAYMCYREDVLNDTWDYGNNHRFTRIVNDDVVCQIDVCI